MAKKVTVSVYADTSNYKRGMASLADDPGIEKATGLFKFLTGAVLATGAALTAITIKGGFERALNIEDATAKLKGLKYSATEIQSVLGTAMESVIGTAYRFDDAVNVAVGAMAAGVKQGKQLRTYLGAVADAASIAKIDMNSMGQIFNKVTSSMKLTGDEINQLNERGIPIVQLLAKEFGKTSAEITKMVSKGQISSEMFMQVMSKNFAGAALSSGDTVRGSFANMGAAIERFGAKIVTPFLPLIKQLFQDTSKWIDSMAVRLDPILEKFFKENGLIDKGNSKLKKFTDYLYKNRDTIAAIAAAIAGAVGTFSLFQGVIEAVNTGFAIMNVLLSLSPLGWLVLALATAAGIFAFITTKNKNWNEVLKKCQEWLGKVANVFETKIIPFGKRIIDFILPPLEKGFKFILDTVTLFFTGNFNGKMFGGALEEDSPFVKGIIKAHEVLGGIYGYITKFKLNKETLTQVGTDIKGIIDGIKNIDTGKVGETVAAGINGIIDQFSGLSKKIRDKVADIDWAQVSRTFLDGLDTVKDEVFKFLTGLISNIDWTELATTVYDNIASVFTNVGKALDDIDWDKVAEFIFDFFGDIGKLISETAKKIDWKKVFDAWGKAQIAAIKFVLYDLPRGIVEFNMAMYKKAAEELVERVKDIDWGKVASKVGELILAALKLTWIDMPKKIAELIIEAIKGGWNILTKTDWTEVGKTVLGIILGIMKLGMVDAPTKIGEVLITAIKGAFNAMWETDWGGVVNRGNQFFFNLIKKFFEFGVNFNQWVFDKIKGAFDWVVNRGPQALANLQAWFLRLPGTILSWLGDAASWLFNIGMDIVRGLLNGAKSMLSSVGNFFTKELPNKIKTNIKSALGIGSPSKVFRAFGVFLIDGLIIGLSNLARVDTAINKVTSKIQNGLNTQIQVNAQRGANASIGTQGNVIYMKSEVHIEGGFATSAEIGRAVTEAQDEYLRKNGIRPAA